MPPPFLCHVLDDEKKQFVLSVVKRAFGMPEHVPHVPVDNPVSLDRRNMGHLANENYTVAFKADGIRYLLVLCMYKARPLAAMVNRAGHVFTLYVAAQASHFYNCSVFDGELCEVTGKHEYDFLVFNALIDQGAMLCKKPYHTRLLHVENNFSCEPVAVKDRPRMQSYIFARSRRLHFVRKEYDMAKNMRALQHNIVPRYKIDGFIFTPLDRGVEPGRDEFLLKHKTDNPIDVLLRIEAEAVNVFVDDNGLLVSLSSTIGMPVHFKPLESETFKSIYEGAVVYATEFGQAATFEHVVEMECRVRDSGLHLSFLRLRPDKDGPNNAVTVQRTLRTIRDDIQLDEIYAILSQK